MRGLILILALLPVSCTGDPTRPLACGDERCALELAHPLPAHQDDIIMGIDNFVRLSPRISRGSPPRGEEAFAVLAARGIRTILTVAPEQPDASRAKRHGLLSVHLPLRPAGLSKPDLQALVTHFQQSPAPFYIHDATGRTTAPAAAAIGRILLDRVGRIRALSEMRWWLGSDEGLTGLYRDVACRELHRGDPRESEPSTEPPDFPMSTP